MNRRDFLSATGAAATGPAFAVSLRDRLQTRAELSSFAATSSNLDVEHFLAALDRRGAPIVRGVLGLSARGRRIPYFVGSRPVLVDGDAARAARKPVVFVVANARATEPDGKEAVLAVFRDLALATGHTILEDMVLVVVPNFNVDANAAVALASSAAPALNGPARVGAALDGAAIDLERDFVALRSKPAAHLVDLIRYWNPDVFIDVRTEALSSTTFGLTYAPALHPAAFYGGAYARDTMLPAIRTQLKAGFGIDAFAAGGFGKDAPLATPLPGIELGWYAPGDAAGIATNYAGIRGTTALTVYANSRDTFERRIFSLRAFLETALQYCSDRSDELITRTRLASHWTTGAIPLQTTRDSHPSSVELISWQRGAADRAPAAVFTSPTPVFDRYVGTTYVEQPYGYVLDLAEAPDARHLLARHGVRTEIASPAAQYEGETYVPERVDRSPVAATTGVTVVSGTWHSGSFTMPSGSLFLYGQQPLGPLASLLVEPESETGLVALRTFDATLAVGTAHVVRRVSRIVATEETPRP